MKTQLSKVDGEGLEVLAPIGIHRVAPLPVGSTVRTKRYEALHGGLLVGEALGRPERYPAIRTLWHNAGTEFVPFLD